MCAACRGEFRHPEVQLKMQVELDLEESLGFYSQEVGCPGGAFSWGLPGLKTQGEMRWG